MSTPRQVGWALSRGELVESASWSLVHGGLAHPQSVVRVGAKQQLYESRSRKGSLALLDVSSRRLNGSNSNKRWSNIEKSVKFRAIETDILRGEVLMVQYLWVNIGSVYKTGSGSAYMLRLGAYGPSSFRHCKPRWKGSAPYNSPPERPIQLRALVTL